MDEVIDITATFNLTYGLFVITTRDGEIDNGCLANTAFQVAENPLKIAISVQTGNYTREIIEKTGKFNISVLTEDVGFETIRHFGMQSGRDINKFDENIAVKRSGNGIYYLTENTNAMFSCDVIDSVDLGSHIMFIGEVKRAEALDKKPSCTYAHYHKAIKPKF